MGFLMLLYVVLLLSNGEILVPALYYCMLIFNYLVLHVSDYVMVGFFDIHHLNFKKQT